MKRELLQVLDEYCGTSVPSNIRHDGDPEVGRSIASPPRDTPKAERYLCWSGTRKGSSDVTFP